jgi:hypothetical protein
VLVRPPRLPFALVLAGALAAAGAAAAGVSSPLALAHTRVLRETGVASTCARPKPTPALDGGTVRYAVVGRENTSPRPRCILVTIRSTRGRPLFSAAYLGGFSPADPGRAYLGDAGTCTDVAQHRSPILRYAFPVPPHARFAIEVEQCSSDRSAPDFALQLRDGAAIR